MFSFMLRALDATWSTPQAPKAIAAIRATGATKLGTHNDTNPAVPTADGVREARNRRVEIVE